MNIQGLYRGGEYIGSFDFDMNIRGLYQSDEDIISHVSDMKMQSWCQSCEDIGSPVFDMKMQRLNRSGKRAVFVVYGRVLWFQESVFLQELQEI